VAGMGPWTLLDDPDPDDPERALVERARAGDVAGATEALSTLASEEFGWYSPGLSDEAICDGFFAGAPPELLAWLDTEGRHRWASDTRDALTTFDGYVRDNLSWAAEWDVDLGALVTPCSLTYGGDDVAVPPGHGRWLRDRLQNADLTIHPGESHGQVIFARLEETLTALVGS
jgi:pimeloyl-ACP methyl ester carboxylesterase